MMKAVKRMDIESVNERKIFTDRKEPRLAFWEMFKKIEQDKKSGKDNIFVLSYYGVGGEGKSTLIDKLRREIAEVEGGASIDDIMERINSAADEPLYEERNDKKRKIF